MAEEFDIKDRCTIINNDNIENVDIFPCLLILPKIVNEKEFSEFLKKIEENSKKNQNKGKDNE